MSITPAWIWHFLCGSCKLGKAPYQLLIMSFPRTVPAPMGPPQAALCTSTPGYVFMGVLKGRKEVSLQVPSSSLLLSWY